MRLLALGRPRDCAMLALFAALSLWLVSFGCSVELAPIEAVGASAGFCSSCADGNDVGNGGTWGTYDANGEAEGDADAAADADVAESACTPAPACTNQAQQCRGGCATTLNTCMVVICGGYVPCIVLCQSNYNTCIGNCNIACVACTGDAGCESKAACGA